MDRKIKEIQENRRRIKKEIYMEIYKQVSRKILKAVEINQKQIFFTVPFFVVGLPLFDRTKAFIYIKRQLELSKFDTVHVSEFELHISVTKNRSRTVAMSAPLDLDVSMNEFPTLINLKKAANRLR